MWQSPDESGGAWMHGFAPGTLTERTAVDRYLALDLASTIRHDGSGGVADDLSDPQGLTAWVRDRAALLGEWDGAQSFVADEVVWGEVMRLREAVRALFAHAVRPAPPSPADAHRLLPLDEALGRVNAIAARQPVTPQLDWPDDATPRARLSTSAGNDAHTHLTAALARATIDFLAGPLRQHLRACSAPRCVRYFLKAHGRQEWCKPSCGNRARVARHHQRHHPILGDDQDAVTAPRNREG
jgi:predicted RNA-binding Zn ribbon-like protein